MIMQITEMILPVCVTIPRIESKNTDKTGIRFTPKMRIERSGSSTCSKSWRDIQDSSTDNVFKALSRKSDLSMATQNMNFG